MSKPSEANVLQRVKALRADLINRVGRVPVVGAWLRALVRRYPEGSVVTIKSGFAAGMKWKRHHRYVNGYWIGNYEYDIQRAIARLLEPGGVFYDVGANAGFFSVMASARVGVSGRVFSFEPLEENIASVREQIAINDLSQVELVPMAMGASEGTATFYFAPGANSVAHLGEAPAAGEREVTVQVTTLDTFAAKHRAPTLVKIDVEGAETDVLAGARATIEKGTRFLIELHGRDKGEAVARTLREAGYVFERLDGSPTERPEDEPHIIAYRR